MTDDVFLSNEEYRKKRDLIRSRQQRIVQVREQSKEMAAAILNRMKQEAEMQYQQTENRVLSEIRQHYSRELANIRQHYNQCISDINQQHYTKHINIEDSSSIKKKHGLKNCFNQRQDERMEPKTGVLKKFDHVQVKEAERGKEMSNPVDNKTSTNLTKSPSLNKKKLLSENKKIAEKSFSLPENIAISSKENNIKSSKVKLLPGFSKQPAKKIASPEKSVMFSSKENCNFGEGSFVMKRYPAYAKKPTNFDSACNRILDPNLIVSDIHVQHDASEMYNRLVHDRIRVLEQKEKILRRRSPIPSSMSISLLKNKPVRFSEYFHNFGDLNVSSAANEDKNNEIQSEALTDDISKDLSRVQIKKKLLVLELSNAATQTEPNASLKTSVESNSSVSGNELNIVEVEESPVKPVNISKSSSKNSYPSPIPKKKEVSKDKIVDTKKPKNSKPRSCKRKQVREKGVTVTVSKSQTGISTNSSDSSSSAVVHSYSETSNSFENKSAVNQRDSHKTVKIVVNVLANSNYKERKLKISDKNKSVAYVIPASNFKKTPNWRKLFDNEEKMTESSYFSPPDMVLEKPNENENHVAKPNKLPTQSAGGENSEKSRDLGYYVKKLLLMRPESIEKLDVSSCSTVTIDDIIEKNDENVEIKSRIKMPLYQNSFDETKILKKSTKLPYYQNSFDDTVDIAREFTLNSHRHNSTLNYDVSSFVEDESVDTSSSSTCEQKFLSSISDSSKYPTGNSVPYTSTCKKLEKLSNVSQSISNPSRTNFDKSKKDSVKNADDATDEDHLKLPTVEELLKRGFISKLILDQQSAGEEETLEEEEFLKRLLTVNIPPQNKKKVQPASRTNSQSSSSEDVIVDVDRSVVCEKPLKESGGEIDRTILDAEQEMNKVLSDVKKENRLLGWMGATVQRTLQASAINSTSSGDSSDPVRQTYKNLENLTEEPFENSPESDSISFSKHFTLSPIKVPDIHFSVLPTSKN